MKDGGGDLLIVGGAGDMGRWLAAELDDVFDVHIHDLDEEAARDLHEERGYPLADPEDVGKFDVVLLSVPIRAVESAAREVGPEMSDGSLLTDVTSVKKGPVEAMCEAVPEGVEVLGMHPMFGPTAEGLRGQTVIMTPVDGEGWYRFLRSHVEEQGAHVEVSTPEEHDRMMSVIQGLTHFSYISFGRALERLDFDVGASRAFMSPVYEVMIDFAGRVLGQNPYLYADIQLSNPSNSSSREALIESARELSDLCDGVDRESIVEDMRSAAKHFGDTSSALRRSDKLVGALVEEREELQRSVGEEVGLLNTRTGVTHVGVLLEYSPDEVRLRETGGEVSLKTGNVRTLDDGEVQRWKAENLPLGSRDLSVVAPVQARSEALSKIPESIEGVYGTSVVDEYAGEPLPAGKKSVTLRVNILHGEGADLVESEARRAFEDLGFELR